MEIRVLEYFLAVAREQNISAAAQSLHLSQPTLSVQLRDLERELGKQLLVRGTKGSRKVTLTDEGRLLQKRAEEIVTLVRKTENEVMYSDDLISGDIYIGAGETDLVRLIARAAKALQQKYPNICYHILSGNADFVMERLDQGLIDIGILYDSVDIARYDSVRIPLPDVWGVLMPACDPLTRKSAVTAGDLADKPLILSQQKNQESDLRDWFGMDISALNVTATYNLIYNGSLFADEGLGYAVCLDKLINTQGGTLCFRPLDPPLQATAYIVRKKHQVFSKAAEIFTGELERQLRLMEESLHKTK